MSKTCLFLLCLTVSLVKAIPAPGHGALTGYCNTNADCHSDECCVSKNQPRGKRTAVDTNLLALVEGHCVKLGTSNSRCLAKSSLIPAADMHYVCPCATNFNCRGTGMYEIPLGEIGACQGHVPLTTGQPCSSGADCADSECCVSNMRPIGRRRRSIGHCTPMGTSGSNCLVRLSSGKPDAASFSCPCTSGLTCVGSGFFDIPLGEMGSCK